MEHAQGDSVVMTQVVEVEGGPGVDANAEPVPGAEA